MKQLWLSAAVLSIVLLSGCMVGPNYSRPDSDVNDGWIEGQDLSVQRDTHTDAAWWKVFDDPVLTRLVESAYRENLDLQIAAVRVLGAMAQRGVAVGGLFPQSQNVDGTFARERSPGGNYLTNWSLALDASWEIDLWGKIRRGIESASAQVDASIAGYDDVMVSLFAEVAVTYISIRGFDEQIAVANENIEVQKRAVFLAQEKYNVGKTSLLDLKQAVSLLAQTQSVLSDSEAGRRQAVFRLSALLGRPPGNLEEDLKGPEKIPAAPAGVAIGVPAGLLRRRPDIREAERQAAAQSALIGVEKAVLYPSFFLDGTIGLGASDFTSLWDASSSWTGIINPGFSWPILNYGRIKNNIRAQDAAFQAAAINYQNAVLKAAQEVESSLAGFLGARNRADRLTESASAAKDAVRISMEQYTEGKAEYTRVLNSQQSLLSVQSRLVSARGDIATNLIGTYKALGGGWEIRNGLSELVSEEYREQMLERVDWGRYFKRLDETGTRKDQAAPHYKRLDPSGTTDEQAGAKEDRK